MYKRFLFIRDDGRNHHDVYPSVEDFLRNARANPTEETWAQPVPYRLPHRYANHAYKLVRDLDVKGGVPKLVVLDKAADQFNLNGRQWFGGMHETPERADLDLEALLNVVDVNYAGAAFLVLYPVDSNGVSSNRKLRSAKIAVKNEDGVLVDPANSEPITSGFENNPNLLCAVLLSVFKMGALPIYVMYVNNDFVINKVWFRNREESDSIVVFGENIPLKGSVFSPVPDPDRTVMVGNTMLVTAAIAPLVIDMFGTRDWQGVIERQEDGSEIVLDDHEPPSLKGAIKIDTDFPYTFDGRNLYLTVNKDVGYLKVEIEAGPFFQDFGNEIKWEWLIVRR